MSTVPEAIVANYCGLNVLGISCISNPASTSEGERLSHEDVIKAADKAKVKFKSLIVKIIESM